MSWWFINFLSTGSFPLLSRRWILVVLHCYGLPQHSPISRESHLLLQLFELGRYYISACSSWFLFEGFVTSALGKTYSFPTECPLRFIVMCLLRRDDPSSHLALSLWFWDLGVLQEGVYLELADRIFFIGPLHVMYAARCMACVKKMILLFCAKGFVIAPRWVPPRGVWSPEPTCCLTSTLGCWTTMLLYPPSPSPPHTNGAKWCGFILDTEVDANMEVSDSKGEINCAPSRVDLKYL